MADGSGLVRLSGLGRYVSAVERPATIEHRSTRLGRRLRDNRLRIALIVALVEGILVLVGSIDWSRFLPMVMIFESHGHSYAGVLELPIVREFLLRGGSAVLDDFHGPIEWDNVVREFGRVFPDRPIVDLPLDHPVFHCFYELDHYPQVPGLGLKINLDYLKSHVIYN